jgi:uncharacterized coiled-coil protein SlyX
MDKQTKAKIREAGERLDSLTANLNKYNERIDKLFDQLEKQRKTAKQTRAAVKRVKQKIADLKKPPEVQEASPLPPAAGPAPGGQGEELPPDHPLVMMLNEPFRRHREQKAQR